MTTDTIILFSCGAVQLLGAAVLVILTLATRKSHRERVNRIDTTLRRYGR